MMMRGGGWFRYWHGADATTKPNVTRRLLLRVLAYAKPYRLQIAGLLGAILITTGLGLLSPLIFREIIDSAPAGKGHRQAQPAGSGPASHPPLQRRHPHHTAQAQCLHRRRRYL